MGTPLPVLLLLLASLLLLVHAVPLQDSQLGLSEVVWQAERPQIYIGSPSLLKLPCDNGWIVSHDFFGSGFAGMARNVTLFSSMDNGTSWSPLAVVGAGYWASLFSVNQTLYLLGTSSDVQASVAIHTSVDCGKTWKTSMLTGPSYATGPTAVLQANGFLYRAVEYWAAPYQWGLDFQAVMLYADVHSDLMSPSSWRSTAPLPFNTSWIPATWPTITTPAYLEGNAVLGPDGNIYNILRFNSAPLANKAVILKLDTQKNDLTFQQFIDFPGGNSKFTIRRDNATGLYITMSNNVTDLIYVSMRNILTLSYSKDLIHWIVSPQVLLSDDTGFPPEFSVLFTGFEYVDWQFDGDDIFYAVRTAYRGANSYHNSNRLTVKWLHNFRDLLVF